MKNLSILFSCVLLFAACKIEPTTNKQSSNAEAPTIRLVYIADNSKSYSRSYSYPDPELFKPLCDKIATHYTLDLRYGVITSKTEDFIRYYAQYHAPNTASSNPWLSAGEPRDTINEVETRAWKVFSASVSNKLSRPASEGSDIATAIEHGIISCQEEPTSSRCIMLLQTDFIDSRGNLPSLPPSIEIVVIGTLPGTDVEHLLNVQKAKHYETLQAALQALSSTF